MFGQVLKFVGFGQRVSELGRFKFRGVHVTPNFIVPSGKTMRRMPKCLEAYARQRPHLSASQVWWGSDIARRQGAKIFDVFVCFLPIPF